ncbi:serine/arginine-rich SC35-like splicing factor SCL30A isoform X1 [Hibiscus syriacus]|uniref:serine/arginine-rich SC35-like splicing factor SCL30A isoform X1 n=1 Tax=Hibiscus syriacus TaxID=106335 RepID=UPI0019228129|nr:serine/arginine-rich SC35-like splicing factor SCL30A isoform X1 [Hibiscus syriacus]
MRGRSYTPSPPRGYGRRGRSPSPRGRYGGRARDLPTSLLVRNLRHDCRPEDLRRPFERFGPLKDIYLPKDYYTGEPRGFGFVQYVDPADATEAKYQMDGQVLLGRELTVVFAEENRKKPTEMRHRERASGGQYRDRRRSPPRYSRSPPRHGRYQSRSRDYSPPPKDRHYSRSPSPQGRYSRERYSRSPPPYNGSRSRSRSLDRGQGPSQGRSRSPVSPREVRSPVRGRSRSPREVGSPLRGRGQSPYHEEYKRELNGERSPSQ